MKRLTRCLAASLLALALTAIAAMIAPVAPALADRVLPWGGHERTWGAPMQTQSPAVTLSELRIELWPEYDRPSMLVQIIGTLDPSVALPAEVLVRVPAASGGPLAVATRSSAGALINAPYTTTVSNDQILVTLRADTADFHVEYYDPGLAITGTARSFAFLWNTDYAVASAGIRVQAPVDSSQLTADPPLISAGPGDFGLNYYTASLGSLTAGQQVSLRLTYSKSTSTLSASTVAASSTQPASAPAATPGLTLASPWLWGGVGAGLVVFGVAVWALGRMRTSQEEARRQYSRRRRPVRPSMARRADPAPPPLGPSAPGEPAGFCTECGQRLRAGDRFCRSCGTPARE